MEATIFIYRLKGLNKSKRNTLNYVLSGRGREVGVLEEVGGFYLGKGVLAVPKENEKTIEEIFRRFGVSFFKLPVEVEENIFEVIKKILRRR